MTLTQLLQTWWHRGAAASPRPPAELRLDRSMVQQVPAEYLPLYTYLEHRYASVVVLTFEQIQAILGFPLPSSASTERDWWTSTVVQTHPYCAAWMGAGRTATPNLSARTVTFER